MTNATDHQSEDAVLAAGRFTKSCGHTKGRRRKLTCVLTPGFGSWQEDNHDKVRESIEVVRGRVPSTTIGPFPPGRTGEANRLRMVDHRDPVTTLVNPASHPLFRSSTRY